jgi:hypothetical protein
MGKALYVGAAAAAASLAFYMRSPAVAPAKPVAAVASPGPVVSDLTLGSAPVPECIDCKKTEKPVE